MNDFSLQLSIGATVAEIYAAITTPASLSVWLDEYAEVDLARGQFDFWGSYSPGGSAGQMRLLGFAPDRSLSFSWLIDGVESTVAIVLTPKDASSTLLSLSHTSLPDYDPDTFWVSDFWHLSLGNLALFVEGRLLVDRVRLPEPAAESTTAQAIIDATPGDVFAALIDPAQVDRWFGRGSTIEPRVGGRYDVGWGAGPIRILDLEPDRQLNISWNYAESDETVVRRQLEG